MVSVIGINVDARHRDISVSFGEYAFIDANLQLMQIGGISPTFLSELILLEL